MIARLSALINGSAGITDRASAQDAIDAMFGR